MKKLAPFLLFLVLSQVSWSQNTFPGTGSAGIGTITPEVSAALEIKSTTQGILVPRMTKGNRDAIVSPATGLLIYQTNSTPGFYYYAGTDWKVVSPKGLNKDLSNLNGPTAASAVIQPNADNTLDLGAASFSWKDLYVDGIGYLGTAKLSNFTGTPQAGMIRWTGNDFEGYSGTSWISLTTGTIYSAGDGIDVAGTTIINTAPDQTVTLDGTGAITVTGEYPNFIISSTDSNTIYSAGTGLSLSGTTFSNTAPTQWSNNGSHISFSSGNVGIGTSSPAQALEVSGTTKTTNLQITSGATPGYVLQSDASGSSIWVSPSGTGAVRYVGNSYLGLSSGSGGTGTSEGNTGNMNNIFIGDSAGYDNGNGTNHIGIGKMALANTHNMNYGVAIGHYALSSASQGTITAFDGDIAIGFEALKNALSTGNNIAIGFQSQSQYIGNPRYNTSTGYQSLLSNSGGKNTAMGYKSLSANGSGEGNTAVGYRAGDNNTIGINNTFIGGDADAGSNNLTNATAIGYNATVSSSNSLILGNGANVGIGTSSPANKLEVVGTTKTTSLQMTTGAASGFVLQSDASGNASWVTPTLLANGSWTITGSDQYSSVGGNIGIGISSPLAKLHIYNGTGNVTLRVESGSGNATLNLGASGSGMESALALNTGSMQRWSCGKSNSAESGGNTGSDFFINRFDDNGNFLSQPVVIKRSTGFIGINQGTPSQQLDVNGTTKTTNLQVTYGASSGFVLQSDVNGNAAWVAPTSMGGVFYVGTGNHLSAHSGTGSNGTAVGSSNTANTDNIFIGDSVAHNMTGTGNNGIIAIGKKALFNSAGNNGVSVAIGKESMSKTSHPTNCVAIGYQTLNSNTSTISRSTAVGYQALQNAGNRNSALGYQAGITVTSGTDNTFIGYLADASANTLTNATAIGANAVVSTSNSLVLGNNTNVGIGTSSPGSRLHVYNSSGTSTIAVQSASASATLHLNAGASGAESTIAQFTNGSQRWSFGKSNTAESGSDAGSDFFFNRYSDAGAFLGQPVVIKRNTGYVGINKSSPSEQLDVNGTTKTTNLQITSGAADGYVLQSDAGGIASWVSPAALNSGPWNVSGNNIYNNNSGLVGIGTSSPKSELHISDGSMSSKTVNDDTGFGASLHITDNVIPRIYLEDVSQPANEKLMSLYSTAQYTAIGSLNDAGNTWDHEHILVASRGGNVGIGTSSPSQLLDVNGTANATTLTAKTLNISSTKSGLFGFVGEMENTGNSTITYNNGLLITAGSNTYNSSFISMMICFKSPAASLLGSVIQDGSASVAYMTTSDQRLKENIRDTKLGLKDLMRIQVSDYNYRDDGEHQMTGYIAQQLHEVFPDAVRKGGEDPKSDPWMVDYGRLTPLLVKSIQELNGKVEDVVAGTTGADAINGLQQQLSDKDDQIRDLNRKLDDVMNRMLAMEGSLSQCCTAFESMSGDAVSKHSEEARLEQNVPNPFMQTSYIRYYIPSSAKDAAIVISNLNGTVIRQFNNLAADYGTVTVDAGILTAGTYQYTLVIDQKVVDTKQMVMTR